MKKSVLLSAIIGILLLMSHTPENAPVEILVVEDCIDLPENPFNYAAINLPPHLSNPNILDTDNEPADNPITDAGATLGRVIFYDKKLSFTSTQSCADCHKQVFAFTDDSQFSRGFQGGFTGRNSMSLINARFYSSGAFFWDERASTLEEQILQPIQDPIEMGLTLEELVQRLSDTDYYPALFEAAFGTPEVTTDRIAKSVSQFIRSMVSYEAKYDEGRSVVGPGQQMVDFPNFTEQENLGKAIFFDMDRGACAGCHQTDAFIAPEPRNNGLDLVYEDNGLGAFTGNPMDNGLFKVPSLRNVELTGPFMHDGRFETLEEVVEHYNSGVQAHPNLSPPLRMGPMGEPRQLNLTDTEKSALVAFLKTLTDFNFITNEKWSDPFCQNPVSTNEPGEEAILTVFPNPVKDRLFIQLTGVLDMEFELVLHNASGQEMLRQQINGKQGELSCQDFPAGAYYLSIHSDRHQIVQKVILYK